jgi:hypothetical protein
MDTQKSHEAVTPRLGGPRGSETEFYLADRWMTDSFGVFRCGDLLIGRDPDDPLRFLIEAWPGETAGFGNGNRPAYRSREDFPLSYVDAGQALHAIICHRLAEFEIVPPREGLDEWAEEAEGRVLEAVEEAVEQARRQAIEELAAIPGQTAAEILAETPVEPDWIIPGVLAPGWAVMLAGREKLGKGSFVFYLLGRLEQGGQETVFGSLPEQPVTAVIYTEEPVESIREKLDAFGLTRAHVVYGWQLAHLNGWPKKAAALVQIAALLGAGIVFVDNISRAAGVEEESGNELSRLGLEPLISHARPLQLAVIIDHHHKKGRDSAENMSRGGTSLPGAVEVKMDMTRVSKRVTDRRRKLTSVGRIRATVWERAIEQTEDGRDYVEIESPPDRETTAATEELSERLMDLRGLYGLGGETTVRQFAALLGLNPETDAGRKKATRRLGALEANGLVEVKRVTGRPNIYRIKQEEVDKGDH